MSLLNLTKDKKDLLQKVALELVGLPYKLGSEVDPKLSVKEVKKLGLSFDCSELVEYIFYQIGYVVPDGSKNQYSASDSVSIIEVGNLLFKRDKNTKNITHSAIVFDENKKMIVEADSWFGRVIIRKYEDFILPTKKNEYAGMRKFNLAFIKAI